MKEKIEQLLKEYSIDHHHEGIVLQESWFDDVSDKIDKLYKKEFSNIWLNSKIYLTKKEIKLIVDGNRNQFEVLDHEFIKVVDDNFEDILL